jgi:hypothetical protein
MENIENLNESELVELWRQLQSMTQEETRDCGDVALLWCLVERLDMANILDQAADKQEQGQSVGLVTALMAISSGYAPRLSGTLPQSHSLDNGLWVMP